MRERMRRGACALMACAACAAGPAHAGERAGILSVVVENDFFAHVDRHYTGGLRVSWLSPHPVPGWLAPVARLLPSHGKGAARVEYAFGQNMYTPTDIGRALPDPADRPYAGWLYGTVGLVVNGASQLDQLQLTLGAVGPASGAKEMQLFIHDVTGSREPRGWGSQLRNELGVNVTYQHTWRGPALRVGEEATVDFAPHAGAALGNVHTYVNGGVTVRLGRNMQSDYGPPRIEPSLPGSSYFAAGTGFGWYLFAGIDARLVGRNIFLDGNTFRDGPGVDRDAWVADLQGGLVLRWRRTRIAYTHVLRSREFRTQDRRNQFGALTFSTTF
jgi:hypothetical protein